MRGSHRGRSAGNLVRLAALTAALCALSGCSTSGDAGAAKEDPRKAAVLAAYQQYWPALLEASNPPDPRSTVLGRVAASPELDRARAVLAARQKAKQVVKGSYEHDARVESVSDDEAKLTDCLTVKTVAYDARTMKVQREDPRGPFPITVSMTLEGAEWKVTDVSSGSRACSSRATSTPSPKRS